MLDVGKTSETATPTTSPKEKKKKKTPKPKKRGEKKKNIVLTVFWAISFKKNTRVQIMEMF